jgi:hypothetical protein
MTEYTQEDAARDFDLKLQKANPKVRDEYHKLLLEKQVKSARGNNDRPVTISTEEREKLFKEADTHIYVGHVDSKKMSEAWDKASREGRGPIGGASDD